MGYRLVAGTVAQWFHDIVLPIWKEHTLEIHPSPEQLEQQLVLQATSQTGNNHHSDNSVMDLSQMTDNGSTILNDEYKLFNSVKIEYIANNVPEGHISYHNPQTDIDKDAVDDYPAENPQPFFVGTSRMTKLFKRLLNLSKTPLWTYLTDREMNQCLKKRKALDFKNPLSNSAIGGAKLSDGYSCLSLYSSFRLIIMEEYEEQGSPDGRAKGRLVFFFINPKYSDKAVQLLHSMMCERHGNRVPARCMMERYVKLLTIFLFPSLTISIPDLNFDVANAEELGQYFRFFFYEYQIIQVGNGREKNIFLITSTQNMSYNLKLVLNDGRDGVFQVNELKMLSYTSTGHAGKEINMDDQNGSSEHHKMIQWFHEQLSDL
jgi:hypothetical protein